MSDIKILKAGQSGFGFLIESDAGYISPDDKRNKPFITEMKKLDSGSHPSMHEPLIVYVVLQKFGILNRNGRIYPESILKSQDKLYQEAIRERRAVGELDHPESSIIAGDRISHNIIETWWEGHTLMGKMEIIMSPGFVNYGIISCKGDDVEAIKSSLEKVYPAMKSLLDKKQAKEQADAQPQSAQDDNVVDATFTETK
mgnify:CR=1 FL=1